jgi:hypothetical protein
MSKHSSKSRRRSAALSSLGIAGVSLALASGAWLPDAVPAVAVAVAVRRFSSRNLRSLRIQCDRDSI